MTTISTRYSVGDVVYHADIISTAKSHPCPDCEGTQTWTAISGSGQQYSFSCPRCVGYQSDQDLSLVYRSFEPKAQRLTIGRVRYDNKPYRDADCASYMCVETGVGSGSVYRESSLFTTEADAMAEADTLAKVKNTTEPYLVKRYNKALSISEYQLSNAKLKLAADHNSKARMLLYRFHDLVDIIKECSDKDEILEAIDDYLKYSWDSDKVKASAKADEVEL